MRGGPARSKEGVGTGAGVGVGPALLGVLLGAFGGVGGVGFVAPRTTFFPRGLGILFLPPALSTEEGPAFLLPPVL